MRHEQEPQFHKDDTLKPKQELKTPLQYRFLNFFDRMFERIPIIDKIGVKRAKDLVEKAEMVEYLKDRGKYLDIGTGSGHVIEEIIKESNKDIEIIGMDPWVKPYRSVRSRLKQDYPEKAFFITAAGQQLPIREDCIDGVILFFVVHHIPQEDKLELFNGIERVVKDGGNIFLVEDTPRTDEEIKQISQWDKRVNMEWGKEEHSYFSDEKWKEFFIQRGYELIHETHFSDKSKREGEIPHSSYVLKIKKSKENDK